MRYSKNELLDFLATREEFPKTLERFPGLTRDELKGLLREAAILFLAPSVEESPPPEPPEPVSAPEAPSPPPAPERERARRLRVYSDGASRGNPGPSGAGAVLTKLDGTPVRKLGKFLGKQTNNFAEYSALLLGLEAARKLDANEVEVYADSELMIRQLQGRYQVKSPAIKPLYDAARLALRHFRSVTLTHILREKNAAADEMSNRAIDERMDDA